MEKQIEHSGDALGKLLKERLKRKKYLTELKSMVTDVVSERLHASAFFAASIVMTCIFLMLFIALWVMLLQRQSQPAYEPLSVLFVWAPVTVCSLVSAIVSWRLFLAKKTFTADKMRGLGAFLICMVIFCIALCIVMGFVAFFFGLYLSYYQSSSGIPVDMMILLENTIAQAGISMNDLQHGLLAEFLAVMTGIPAFLVVLFVLFVVMLVKTIGHINFFAQCRCGEVLRCSAQHTCRLDLHFCGTIGNRRHCRDRSCGRLAVRAPVLADGRLSDLACGLFPGDPKRGALHSFPA